MATLDITSERPAGAPLAQPVVLVAFALTVANAVYLLASWLQGLWPDGTGVPSDFVGVWAAGRLVLTGHPAAVYDWPVHKLVEQTAVGHPFDGYYGWHYPPTFLFIAIALSLLPYRVAYVVWAFGTFPAYLAAIRSIIGARVGYLLAAAFPAVLANVIVGQNGFISAGLIGGALTLLERRPVLAGVLLGLLTYKPHLGLLFPVALIAGRQWRVIIAATVVAILMAAVSWLAFGGECWQAFVGNIGHTEHVFLSQGQADLNKLQTAFGLTRTLGGSEPLAWSIQIVVALAAAAAVAVLWRKTAKSEIKYQIPYEIKAAALGAALLLATPYLYAYDLVVLAVPLAFLFRLGLTGGFLPYELSGIGIACLLVLIFPFVSAPTGFAALVIVTALIARRALMAQRLASPAAGTATAAARVT